MPVQAKGAVFSPRSSRPAAPPRAGPTCGRPTRRSTRTPANCIADNVAYHSLFYSQGRSGYLPSKQNDQGGYDQYGYHDLEPSLRPLVKVHPDTGRPNLLIGRHAYGIVGMDPAESERAPRPPQRVGVPAAPRALPPVGGR